MQTVILPLHWFSSLAHFSASLLLVSVLVAEPVVEEVKVFQRVITLDSLCHPDYKNLSSLRSQIMISRTQQSVSLTHSHDLPYTTICEIHTFL